MHMHMHVHFHVHMHMHMHMHMRMHMHMHMHSVLSYATCHVWQARVHATRCTARGEVVPAEDGPLDRYYREFGS